MKNIKISIYKLLQLNLLQQREKITDKEKPEGLLVPVALIKLYELILLSTSSYQFRGQESYLRKELS